MTKKKNRQILKTTLLIASSTSASLLVVFGVNSLIVQAGYSPWISIGLGLAMFSGVVYFSG